MRATQRVERRVLLCTVGVVCVRPVPTSRFSPGRSGADSRARCRRAESTGVSRALVSSSSRTAECGCTSGPLKKDTTIFSRPKQTRSSRRTGSLFRRSRCCCRRRAATSADRGPAFPFVVPRDDGPWLMYYCTWGSWAKPGGLSNRTGLAQSHDAGLTWERLEEPLLPLGPPGSFDAGITGSVCVIRETDGETSRSGCTTRRGNDT